MESALRTIKNNKSVGYYLLFFTVVVMTAFFFTSRMILPDDTPVLNTEIGEKVLFGKSTELVLERWEYNSEKNFMEVEVGIENFAEILEKEIKIEAITRKDTKKSLPIKEKLKTNDRYILEIRNLPKGYHTVGLKFSFEEKTGEDEAQTTEKTEAFLYSDYRKVKINNKLKEKTKTEYLIAATEREIESTEKNIKDLDKKIDENNQKTYGLNRSIAVLNEEMTYQIESEKQKMLGTINRYESQKADLERDNEQMRLTQKELRNKRDKLEEKLLSIEK